MIEVGLHPIELTVKCPTCLKDNVVEADQTQIELSWITCAHCGSSWAEILPGPMLSGPFPEPAK